MATFGFYRNGNLSKMSDAEFNQLKEAFPKFFEKNRKPVYIRVAEHYRHEARVGINANRLKTVKRPNSPLGIVMQTRSFNEETRMIDTITISAQSPIKDPRTQKDSFGKHAYLTIGHNTRIEDENVLYFLYYHYDGIAGGLKGNERANFQFVQEEKEAKINLEKTLREGAFAAKVGSLSDDAVTEILRKHNIGGSEVAGQDKLNLIGLFNRETTEVQDNLTLFVDSLLGEAGEEKNAPSGDDVDTIVQKALDSGVLKIEDGKVYTRKLGSEEYNKTAKLTLKNEDLDLRRLEIVTYFGNNPNELEKIK